MRRPSPVSSSSRAHGPLRTLAALAVVSIALPAAGCGRDDVRYEIRDVRTVSDAGPPAPPGATDEERFGGAHAMGGDSAGATGPASHRWAFTTPDGWTALPPARMRDHGWRVGPVECTLSLMEGAAGGLLANVNRWRKQMSLGPVEDEAIDALPKTTWLGVEARRIELDGTYVGMGGTSNVARARLVGLVARLPRGTAFLKMVGPEDVVETERKRFLALAESLRLLADEAPSATPSPDAPSGSPLSWTAPEGWVRQPERPMRLVTFSPASAPKVSVYVTVLPARAGGLRANLDRWYAEMGKPAPTDAEVAALPRGRVLGDDGVFVEVEGAFKGMGSTSAEPGSLLLGLIVERASQSVFVKMTGPAEDVRRERERFRAFCESLHE